MRHLLLAGLLAAAAPMPSPDDRPRDPPEPPRPRLPPAPPRLWTAEERAAVAARMPVVEAAMLEERARELDAAARRMAQRRAEFLAAHPAIAAKVDAAEAKRARRRARNLRVGGGR